MPPPSSSIFSFTLWSSIKRQNIITEIIGGITMFLVSTYILSASQGWQGGSCPNCGVTSNATSSNKFTALQYQAIPSNVALTAGLSTILMGLIGDLPVVLASGLPGITYGDLARTIGAPGAQGAVLVVGLLVSCFAFISRQIHFIAAIPEDLRLGMAAGKGGLIALVALRNMGIVSTTGTAFVSVFNYNMILSMVGLGVLIALLQRQMNRMSYIISIAVVVFLSLVIRAATGTVILRPFDMEVPTVSALAGAPDFTSWTSSPNNAYTVFRYIIVNSIQIIIDMVVTITAIVLTAVVSRLGYDREIFTYTLSDSAKMVRVFGTIGLVNVIIAPWFGVAPATPFIQSTAGIVVGARSGLSAVVCGSLFIMLSMCANPVATIIPLAAMGPVVFMACLPSVQGLKFIDYHLPSRYGPALFAFFLMTLTSSIPMGCSYGITLLVGVWICTGDWKYFSPQLMACFYVCIVLLVMETQLVTTVEGLGALLGGAFGLIIITWLIMSQVLPNNFIPITSMGANYPSNKKQHVFSWGNNTGSSTKSNHNNNTHNGSEHVGSGAAVGTIVSVGGINSGNSPTAATTNGIQNHVVSPAKSNGKSNNNNNTSTLSTVEDVFVLDANNNV
jgi:AGZA family xanthine/uracil permease-like MFS transporter